MPKLIFIRHGETKMNVSGILTGTLETDLTDKGIEAAKKLSTLLKDNFDYYYCSPLKRTHQTLFAIKGDVKFIQDDRLIEVSSGLWQGKYKSLLPKDEYDLYKAGLFDPPGGEKLQDVDKRIRSFLKDMFENYGPDDKILIVTHNAFMRNLKRLFINDHTVVEPKNLEIFEVNNDMYNEYIGKSKTI